MCNLTNDEITQLGLWSLDVSQCHYFFVYEADLCARLSGYTNKSSYWIARSLATTADFRARFPESGQFFDGFLPFVDDSEVELEAIRMRQNDTKTPLSVLRALRAVKETFFQDLAFYKRHYPEMKLFSSQLFVQNEKWVEKWISYVESFDSMEAPRTHAEESQIEIQNANQFGQIREQLHATNQLLNQLSKQMIEDNTSKQHTTRSVAKKRPHSRADLHKRLTPMQGAIISFSYVN